MAQTPIAYAMRWPDHTENEKPVIFWPEQVAAHGVDMQNKGQTLTPLFEGSVPDAVQKPDLATCIAVAKELGSQMAAWEGIGGLDVLEVWKLLAKEQATKAIA